MGRSYPVNRRSKVLTLIFNSHDPAVVRRLSHWALAMYLGKVMELARLK